MPESPVRPAAFTSSTAVEAKTWFPAIGICIAVMLYPSIVGTHTDRITALHRVVSGPGESSHFRAQRHPCARLPRAHVLSSATPPNADQDNGVALHGTPLDGVHPCYLRHSVRYRDVPTHTSARPIPATAALP